MSKKSLTKSDLIQMGWILLEYEVVHFLETTHLQNAKPEWLSLRKISNEVYDKKVMVFKKLAARFSKKVERPIEVDASRPSVRMIIDKFSLDMFSKHVLAGSNGKIEVEIFPLVWPDIATETDEELTLRAMSEVFASSKVRVKKKMSKRKKAV